MKFADRFKAWELSAEPVEFDVPASPVGPINVWSFNGDDLRHIQHSAVVLFVRRTVVDWPGSSHTLSLGCYAQVPGGTRLLAGAGLVIETPDYHGLPQVGGPVERQGRLKYIDGCSDSLLICPAIQGDPCLNLLHLPKGTTQTAHTHPSDRIGIILRGRGVCKIDDGECPLLPGMFWYIPPDFVHSFHTPDDSLDVLAWHPDSDFGPSHDWHPMVNRTIVDGTPANDPRHAGIRTQ